MEPEPNITVITHPPDKSKNSGSLIKSKTRIITTILGIFLLTGALGIGAYLVQQNQENRANAGGVTLSLVSNNQNPAAGGTFTVAVAVDSGGQKISAADIKINYDSNLLTATSIQPGNFLPTVLVNGQAGSGTARIVLGGLVDQGGPHPVSGTGVLAQITFNVKTAGTASISFDPATVVTIVSQTTNGAGTKNPLQITLGTAPALTPTPTPSPSQTVLPSISSVGVLTGANPWHLDIRGTNMDASQRERLFDSTDLQWGSDIPLYILSSAQSSIVLPSNSPPSGCNKGKTCTISIQILTSQGEQSNKFSFNLPAQ